MVYVYDVEIFPNFFSIVLWNVNSDEKLTYYIFENHNDINNIVDLFQQNHWFCGYNSTEYDDLIIEYVLSASYRFSRITSDQITKELFEYSKKIIESNKKIYSNNLFNSFDLMRVCALYKSLKLVGIDLKHERVQDLPYEFDHVVMPDEVDKILDYNHNDVEITYKLYQSKRKQIQLRQTLSKKYGQNLMNYPDSGIANRILEKNYEEFSGTPQIVFKNINTKRDIVHFKDIISDKIKFETDYCNSLLKEIKSDSADKSTKIEYNVLIGSTVYDIKKGGIHSARESELFSTDKNNVIIDADVTSYYIYLMIKYGIKSEHLHPSFLTLLQSYLDMRVKAKTIDKGGVDDQSLKIVILSIFGKLGNEYHWLYDLKALYETTLNGQLFLLMLIEKLEMNGIPVKYANTDGITVHCPTDKQELYYEICQWWQDYTDLNLEFEKYKSCINRDVNNYIWISEDDSIKYKGFFDVNRYKDVTKGYDKPIIPIAISKYFTENIPVEQTIIEHNDILNFCMAQKASEKFDIYYDSIVNGKFVTKKQQKTNRYFVGKKGGSLYKLDPEKDERISLVAGEPVHILNDVSDKNAQHYPIKYSYYIREANKIIRLFNNNQQDLFL